MVVEHVTAVYWLPMVAEYNAVVSWPTTDAQYVSAVY